MTKGEEMKSILLKISVSALILVSITIQSFSQTTDADENIMTLTHYANDTVRLRWIPMDYEKWQLGNIQGYSVVRLTLISEGVQLSQKEIESSRHDVLSEVLPLSSSSWDAAFPSDNAYAMLAKEVLYRPMDDGSNSATLRAAADAEQQKLDRFNFGIVAAFIDFDVAVGMALGVEDTKVRPNSQYIYHIKIEKSDLEAAASVNTAITSTYEAIFDVGASQSGKSASIEWNIAGLDEEYVAYHIERSDDASLAQSFQNVNEMPYVFFAPVDESVDITTPRYIDTSVNEESSYTYRVRGVTPFGTLGPPSSTADVTIKALPLNIVLLMNAENENDEQVNISWRPTGEIDKRALTGYNIYRSSSPESIGALINSTPVSGNSFTDVEPITAAYYTVEAIDDLGAKYMSISKLVILPDNIPPEVPTGLTARLATDETVEFTWDANADADLEGYFIYTHLTNDSVYITANNSVINSDSFTFMLPEGAIYDTLCFKISAMDVYGNESDMSESYLLELPDRIPPARPIIDKLVAIDQGISVTFVPSESEDRAYHYILRRVQGFQHWDTIYTAIHVESFKDFPSGTLDKVKNLAWYEYRVICIDRSGNVASSDILKVFPYIGGYYR